MTESEGMDNITEKLDNKTVNQLQDTQALLKGLEKQLSIPPGNQSTQQPSSADSKQDDELALLESQVLGQLLALNETINEATSGKKSEIDQNASD